LVVDVAGLTVQSRFEHQTGVVGDSLSTTAAEQIELCVMKIRVAALAIGFDRFCPGYGLVLNGGVTEIAFDLVIGDMVFMHQITVLVMAEFVNFRMAGTASISGYRTISDHHLSMAFAAFYPFFHDKSMVIG
jgi:hypothetical protein